MNLRPHYFFDLALAGRGIDGDAVFEIGYEPEDELGRSVGLRR